MSKPRLLDLFCCQGGASRGYADAGFDVMGVDIDPAYTEYIGHQLMAHVTKEAA